MPEQSSFTWPVPADHPAFAGHFPGRPIVPGVVLLDRAISLAEVRLGTAVAGWQVGNAKFLSPVGPGEILEFTLTTAPGASIAFTVRAGERLVASGSLTPASP
jgi:3-hydroxymyristoyl/3-hydroxydecanoyl-(acyl carrier protein) dehydratase